MVDEIGAVVGVWCLMESTLNIRSASLYMCAGSESWCRWRVGVYEDDRGRRHFRRRGVVFFASTATSVVTSGTSPRAGVRLLGSTQR